MTDFKFHTPITVRYIDLDAQWHVNNAHFFSFIEQARYSYLVELGLFNGQNFLDFPIIVADAHLSYQQPIPIGVQVDVGVAVTRIGNKSLRFEYIITDPSRTIIYATGDTTNVTYDFHTKTSKPVPGEWREKISQFEGHPF
ncbi:MAG TPA: acyl-CoA thioesterase [Anaerolineaceae bacterium]|jgi:acyl-CoA thioester hydrolase|nr:acyl-CoA thioesterase [Anaerolineaceae bacterium]